jgi:hypothetical protein
MQIYGNIICGAECEGYRRPLFEFFKKLLQEIPKNNSVMKHCKIIHLKQG